MSVYCNCNGNVDASLFIAVVVVEVVGDPCRCNGGVSGGSWFVRFVYSLQDYQEKGGGFVLVTFK